MTPRPSPQRPERHPSAHRPPWPRRQVAVQQQQHPPAVQPFSAALGRLGSSLRTAAAGGSAAAAPASGTASSAAPPTALGGFVPPGPRPGRRHGLYDTPYEVPDLNRLAAAASTASGDPRALREVVQVRAGKLRVANCLNYFLCIRVYAVEAFRPVCVQDELGPPSDGLPFFMAQAAALQYRSWWSVVTRFARYLLPRSPRRSRRYSTAPGTSSLTLRPTAVLPLLQRHR